MDCSSQQYKNHLPLLYLYFSSTSFIFHNQTFQVCLQVKQEGEGKEGRELRNYSANYMLMGKKTQKTKNPQRKKVLCRFFKPVLSMAPKQDPSLLGSNCQLTLDLSQNVGSMLPMAVNLLSHCISAMLRDAFSSPSNHSRIPQESAVGVSGLQVPLILFICSRDLKVPVLYSQQKKKCSNTCWRHSRNYCCAEEACGV